MYVPHGALGQLALALSIFSFAQAAEPSGQLDSYILFAVEGHRSKGAVVRSGGIWASTMAPSSRRGP